MAITITPSDINDFYPSGASDAVINSLIAFIDQADTCLDASGVSDDTQKLVKIYAVCHMLTMQSGGGVKSESDMDGESVTFGNAFDKNGLAGSAWGSMLGSMDGYSCIAGLIDKPRRSSGILNATGL
jgi:hypothetical protein